MAVQGQTAQASVLWGHSLQRLYAKCDYGIGKGETEPGIEIPKDLGIVVGQDWVCLLKCSGLVKSKVTRSQPLNL